MKTINISSLKELKERKDSLFEYKLRLFARGVEKEFAKRNGKYHSVVNPDGLTELTPPMKNGGSLESPCYYKVMDDGRVHKLERFQYAYIYGPEDHGIVKFSEWWENPNNTANDIDCILNRIFGFDKNPIFWNKFLIPELEELIYEFSLPEED